MWMRRLTPNHRWLHLIVEGYEVLATNSRRNVPGGMARIRDGQAGIASQRWDWGTIPLNAETALTRDHHADIFLGSIIEAPTQ
jgi:hypothetical protein